MLIQDTLLDPGAFASTLVSDLSIPSENIGIIADLIRTQIEEAQGLTAVDILDAEAVEDEVTFDEGDDKDEGVAEDEQEVWREADCRVILNVCSGWPPQSQQRGPLTSRPARPPDLQLHPARPDRVGSLLLPPTIAICRRIRA